MREFNFKNFLNLILITTTACTTVRPLPAQTEVPDQSGQKVFLPTVNNPAEKKFLEWEQVDEDSYRLTGSLETKGSVFVNGSWVVEERLGCLYAFIGENGEFPLDSSGDNTPTQHAMMWVNITTCPGSITIYSATQPYTPTVSSDTIIK